MPALPSDVATLAMTLADPGATIHSELADQERVSKRGPSPFTASPPALPPAQVRPRNHRGAGDSPGEPGRGSRGGGLQPLDPASFEHMSLADSLAIPVGMTLGQHVDHPGGGRLCVGPARSSQGGMSGRRGIVRP